MDSLTQIVLGAACGEAVAGKKIGNRAMIWGAIGGTIPDLDVFASFFTDNITGIAFHRGFMHSFLFAALAPWALAKLSAWFYGQEIYRRRGYKTTAMALWLLLYAGAATGINLIPASLGNGVNWYTLFTTVLLGAWFAWRLWRDYWNRQLAPVEASYMTWVWLFFWSIFTHPILDCFTSWGTQIWQPFADTRIQWSTVSVVDPMATVPFGICLLVASRLARTSRARMWWNYGGLAWFCLYLMGYTIWHKNTVNTSFEAFLNKKGIQYDRYYSNPTIFNNIVWYGVAEGDTAYYFSQYGFNDCRPGFGKLSVIPKRHDLLASIPENERALQFLRWFTHGYYSVRPYHGDTLQVNDLRFGLLGDTLGNNNYVFPFLLYRTSTGTWDIYQNNRNKEQMEENKASFSKLWQKIKGEPCQ